MRGDRERVDAIESSLNAKPLAPSAPVAGMRLAAVVGIAVALAAGEARADEAARVRAAVQALPVIGTIEHGATPVVVRGALEGRRARDMLALARLVVSDVGRRFVAPRRDKAAPVTLCLTGTTADYQAFTRAFAEVPSDLGFYRPDLRVGVANLGRGAGNLRHELVHPLVGDDYPEIPSWLNEGLGSLYGTARVSGARLEPMVNYRLRDLQRAIAAGTLPSLDALVASSSDDVYSDRAPVFYAMGRYLLLYLHQKGRLEATYAALRDASGDVRAQQRIIRAEVDDVTFVRWARRLRLR